MKIPAFHLDRVDAQVGNGDVARAQAFRARPARIGSAAPMSSFVAAAVRQRERRTLRAMMNTPHLGEAGVHPVIASSARELLNKSDNERSGVLSTADLVASEKPVSLYLVVPPSDINRTKPLIRLLLNQVGRRLTVAGIGCCSCWTSSRRSAGSTFSKALSLFIRFWMTVAPPLPDSAHASAKAKGTERFEGFLQTLGRKLATGDRFLKGLSRDIDTRRDGDERAE